MSQTVRVASVRARPRWSTLPTSAPVQIDGFAAPIAALPWPSAIVLVGPALPVSGPRRGSAVREKPHDASPNWRLLPPSVTLPVQLLPPAPETMVFEAATVPNVSISPPWSPLRVTFSRVVVPSVVYSAPPDGAVLPDTVLLTSVVWAPSIDEMAPPASSATLLEKVLLEIVKTPESVPTPPPPVPAWFPLKVLVWIVAVEE